jgi:hypothetical protein
MKSRTALTKKAADDDSAYTADYLYIKKCINAEEEFKGLLDCTKHFRMKGYTVLQPIVKKSEQSSAYVQFLKEGKVYE